MKVYYVSCDRQGASFGMGRLYTAYEWLEQAVDWWDSDDFWESDNERAEFLYNWLHRINSGEEDQMIEYISEIWELDFEVGNIEEGIPKEFDPDEREPEVNAYDRYFS